MTLPVASFGADVGARAGLDQTGNSGNATFTDFDADVTGISAGLS